MKNRIAQIAFASLLAAGCANATIIYDVTSSLALSDPTQLGRLSRNAIPQDWSGGELYPGSINTTTTYHYKTYTIAVGSSPYLQIEVDSTSANTFFAVYQGSYNPASFATNWLGDEGQSGNYFGTDTEFFQVVATAFTNVVLVVNNTGAANAGVGDPFHVIVEGFVDTAFTDPSPAPEPASYALFGGGLFLLVMFRKRAHVA